MLNLKVGHHHIGHYLAKLYRGASINLIQDVIKNIKLFIPFIIMNYAK